MEATSQTLVTSVFGINPKTKPRSIPEIVNSINVSNSPRFASNLEIVVNSINVAKNNKAELKHKIVEKYVQYKKTGLITNVESSGTSTLETLNGIRKWGAYFVEGFTTFLRVIIEPILSIAWSALTYITEFLVETVFTTIVEIIAAVAVANPVVLTLLGVGALAATAYFAAKAYLSPETKELIANKVQTFVSPIIEKVKIIIEPNKKEVSKPLLNKVAIAGENFTATAITGLTDAETNALANVASKRESSNNMKSVNSIGYVGLYQFGATALADTGFVNLAKYKAYKNKTSKIKYKGQLEFLQDPDNWNDGKSLDSYFSSKEDQDLSFKRLAENNIKSASDSIKKNPSKLGGFILSSHLLGASAANAYVNADAKTRAKLDKKDAYGTRVSEYNDLGIAAIDNSNIITLNKEKMGLGLPINSTNVSNIMQKQEQINLSNGVDLATNNVIYKNTEVTRTSSGQLVRIAN